MSAAGTRPVVDRDALVEWFHEREHKVRWPCTDADACGNLRRARYQADAILAAGLLQDATDVRRAVAEEIAAAIEAAASVASYVSPEKVTEALLHAARIARAAAHPRSP